MPENPRQNLENPGAIEREMIMLTFVGESTKGRTLGNSNQIIDLILNGR